MLRTARSYRPSLKTALLFIITVGILFYVKVKWNSPTTKEGASVGKSLASPKSNTGHVEKDATAQESFKSPKLNNSPRKKTDTVQKIFKPPKDINPTKLSQLMNRFTVKDISCSKLFNKDAKEQEKALQMTSYRGPTLPLDKFADINCETFTQERGYITSPLTSEEANFPIAYSIMVYKDLGQVERLFRAIYRPQNAYCFHADKKSPKEFHEGLRRLVSCFPNVMMSSRSVNVQWGGWTNLECDLICMNDLVNRFPKWKYLINLTGQEFPLHTNLELVRILKTFNGANSVLARPIHSNRIPKKKLPFQVKWIMGSVHIVAVRGFIEFMFKNTKAVQITNLLRNMPHPDETLFGTLSHNPQLGAPGASLGYANENAQDRFIARVKHGMIDQPCESGYYVRWNCIFGIKDLPFLGRQPELFINKLFWDFQPLTYSCLEERIFNITWRDHFGLKPPLDLEVYKKLDIVKYHL